MDKRANKKPTSAEKLQIVMELLGGQPIYDEYGNPTGDVTAQLITKEQALELLNFNEDNEHDKKIID